MSAAFHKLVKNRFKFNLFLLTKLPAAYFSGVQVMDVSEEKSVVSIQYKWFNTNPFRSTYFACLSMAAEMSTGVLAMAHIYEQEPAVSMLVQNMEAEFLKKATGKTIFTCREGVLFQEAIKTTKNDGLPQLVKAIAEGRDASGDLIARFTFTWSLKRKSTTSA